MLQDIHLMN